MTTKYLYKGQEVKVVQQFTTHYNVYYQEPMEHGGTRQVNVSCPPGQDLQLVEDNAPIAIADKPDVSNQEFNINAASFTAIRAHLPGIGRVAPKTVINNRPNGGYKNFEQFCELNKKLNLNWDELKPILLFE
jgi:DNA uptake protein ComE-like DNA-binding protein